MRQCLVVRSAAVVVGCLLGCGGGARLLAGEGKAVVVPKYTTPKATFNTMWDAAKAGNKDAMMACFSEVCRKKIVELEKIMADLPNEARKPEGGVADQMVAAAKTAKSEIGVEKLDGDKATLEVTTDGRKETLDFVKEKDNWKLHIRELAELDIEQMKQAIEMMKKMKEGIEKGTKEGEAPEKGTMQAPEKAKAKE